MARMWSGRVLALCIGVLLGAGCAASRERDGADGADAVAALLLRCKVGELEEGVWREGLPDVGSSGDDACCAGAEVPGHRCEWSIDGVNLEDTPLDFDGLLGPAAQEPDADEARVALRTELNRQLGERVRRATVRVLATTRTDAGSEASAGPWQVHHLLFDRRSVPREDPTAQAAADAGVGP